MKEFEEMMKMFMEQTGNDPNKYVVTKLQWEHYVDQLGLEEVEKRFVLASTLKLS